MRWAVLAPTPGNVCSCTMEAPFRFTGAAAVACAFDADLAPVPLRAPPFAGAALVEGAVGAAPFADALPVGACADGGCASASCGDFDLVLWAVVVWAPPCPA